MTDQPLPFRWEGDGFVPLNPFWAKRADQQYVVGAVYRLASIEERSAASHNQFFAAVAEAHTNLPDELTERLPTPDHLRKYALIRTGWRDERTFVCASKAEALRLASFVRPMDEFCVVSVAECAVVVWNAKSQSYRAMGKADFTRSKSDVLDFLASLIGTTPEALERQMA